MVVLAVDFGFLPTCGIGLRTDTENVFCFPPQLFIQEQVLIQLLHPLGRCLTILRRTQMGCFPGRRHSLENFRRGFYGKDTKLVGQPETESQLRHHGNSGGTDAYSTTTQAYVYSASGVSINGKIVPFTQYSETYGSADLGWEKSYNWNIGLDFGVLNSRIDGSIEWFRTTTKGLLFKRILPITSGLTGWGSPLSIWQNIAQTSNQGVEVILNSHNIQHKDFTWNTTLSATWSKEKIDKLPDGDLISENLFTGEPIHAIYGYKYAGIWGSDTPKETLDAYGVNPGFIKIETVDKNGDGGVHKYSTDDRQILGHTNPDWIIGLNNSFTYKNFDLSVFAMARYGQTINSDLLGYYTAEQSVTKNQLEAWITGQRTIRAHTSRVPERETNRKRYILR